MKINKIFEESWNFKSESWNSLLQNKSNNQGEGTVIFQVFELSL